MKRLFIIRTRLDELSNSVLLAAEAIDATERTELLLGIQREIRAIHQAVKDLEDRPPVPMAPL